MAVDQLLGIKEVAEILGIAPGTLRNWHFAGKGPKSFKVGGLVKYRESTVRRWIAAQERSRPVAR
jgi:predicted DNA-binding transcriptional regulator AlpA